MGKSPMLASAKYGQKPHVSFGEIWATVQRLNSNALVYMPIEWWQSSCQTRRHTSNVPLVRCIDLLVLNG
uniref:Uncharacterized protein n=1 Tax=Meloidogyne enterolobii TaxID=390850 RepID=A0A6V7U1C9_MELEN|nr:unnamed protein product [Meloidogyne enterolobii]